MQTSPLQLEGYYVTTLTFNLRHRGEDEIILASVANMQPKLESAIPESPLTFDVSVNYGSKADDPSRHRIEFSVRSNLPSDSQYPYDFHIKMIGFFRQSVTGTPNADSSFVRTNGLSILFSIAREIISNTTSQGPYPGVLLPVVSFVGSPLVNPQIAKDVAKPSKGKAKASPMRARSKKSTKEPKSP